MSALKEEVRTLVLQEHEPTSGKSIFFSGFYSYTPLHSVIELFNRDSFYDLVAPPLFLSHSRVARVEEADSDSGDFSPTPSLAEVSSDGLSWLDDKDLGEKESCLKNAPSAVSFCTYCTVMLHAES